MMQFVIKDDSQMVLIDRETGEIKDTFNVKIKDDESEEEDNEP